MADDQKRPDPDLIDKNKGSLVEKPGQTTPTPAEKDVKNADDNLNSSEQQPS